MPKSVQSVRARCTRTSRSRAARGGAAGARASAAGEGAWRELIRRAVLTHGMRPVEVSRYLSISKSSVAEHLRIVS